jgi:putative transposase
MSVHLVIKAKLVVALEAAQELKSTMTEFNKACNTLSELAYEKDLHRKYDIHHEGYDLIREETNLPSQHVINAIAKVGAAYVRDDEKLHRFKPYSSIRYDARTMKIGQDCSTASLTVCPKGRVTGQLQMSNAMRQKLNRARVGTAELVLRNDEFFLHLSVEEEAPETNSSGGSLGIDLGVNRTAVGSNKKFYTAKKIRHKKACFKRTRRSLQANGSKSAKRALGRLSGRERRFVSDVNHQISKQIVADAKAHNQKIVLEDLTGIRQTGKAKCIHDWSFNQLQFDLEYKAKREGVEIVFVDPRYTSQTCSRCLHLGQRFNQSSFVCPNCGLELNADLNGSRSIALRHDLPAMGRYFCEYNPEVQINRPKAVRSRKSAHAKIGTANRHYNRSSDLVAGS